MSQPAPPSSDPTRIAIVGAGSVGATCAYALLLSGLAREIVLIDTNRARAEGEAMDLSHAAPFAQPARIWAGDLADCAGAAVTILCAGAAQKPGETRLDLARKNTGIVAGIAPEVARHNPDGILLIASNPVDVLTYAAWKLSGLPAAHVIGSGTVLDTARFRHLLSLHFHVDPRSVHAFIIGEHGDSEAPVWSLANIAGMPLAAFAEAEGTPYDAAVTDDLFRQTQQAAYQIIERKGATYYAVGAGLTRIVEAILRDQSTVLPVSSLITGYYGIDDVSLSLPTIIGRGGVERVLRLPLAPAELDSLRRSAGVLRATLRDLDLTG
jgi:L-lactate dehydrogenase